MNKPLYLFAFITANNHKIKCMFKKSGLFILLLIFSTLLFAQAPGGVPYGDPEPVEWDLFNVILLIGIPVLILVVYFWRKRNKKK